jgi:hypothetical protein
MDGATFKGWLLAMMTESTIRQTLLGTACAGLALGLMASFAGINTIASVISDVQACARSLTNARATVTDVQFI